MLKFHLVVKILVLRSGEISIHFSVTDIQILRLGCLCSHFDFTILSLRAHRLPKQPSIYAEMQSLEENSLLWYLRYLSLDFQGFFFISLEEYIAFCAVDSFVACWCHVCCAPVVTSPSPNSDMAATPDCSSLDLQLSLCRFHGNNA